MKEPFHYQQLTNGLSVYLMRNWMDRWPILSAGISARNNECLSTTKVSRSLNLALHVGDDETRVLSNRTKLAAALNIPMEAWTCGEQVHDCEIHKVELEDVGRGSLSRTAAIQNKDALITNKPGLWLISFYADCVPIYLWDPVRLAVGISHAGWKGTVSSIASKTVQAMVQVYGSSPEHIHVTIGPSIGMCCYEVNQDVARQVQPFAHRNNKENPLIIPCGLDKYKIDLKETNRQILLKAGILADHIELTKLCTSCDNDYLFSHRKENGQTGRMAAWIGLNLERGDHAFEPA